MKERIPFDFHFLATGIGSVPYLDVPGTCRRILAACPRIPFWPQFVQRSHFEDMIVQFTEDLPFLEVAGERNVLITDHAHAEQDLLAFYDRFLAEDVGHFALSKDYAPGLYEMLALIEKEPEKYGPFIKGHTVGPVTFAAAIRDQEGRNLFAYTDSSEALVKALAIRALWQVRELAGSGKKPILFLDEPYLAGFGSAFTPIQRHEVVAMIKEVVDYVRERSEVIIGIHCCGNTDWTMIFEAGPDIVSFDAFSYMDYFFLYPAEVRRFIETGGAIAWGIVPTFGFTGRETVEDLSRRLQQGLAKLHALGLDPDYVAKQSLLTPACGMGTMEPAAAERVLTLLHELSERYHVES
jgi:methionine synthase II (cobalamin-independent)